MDTRPSKKMYGLLHTPEGAPIIREPRTVKTGIGLLKGKEIHVYIDNAKKWVVQVGKDLKRFDSKLEAKKYYRSAKATAPDRRFPSRISYFTFSHVGSDGSFEPDWEIIESHGPMPMEIGIVFVGDDPFEASYQLWTSTERKCEGDGINALRVLSMANTEAEKKLAGQAQQKGERFFPVVNGCWTRGCPFSQPQGEKPSQCRPHGRLRFQLLNSPVLGGTAEFVTSGNRSISQIFSCLEIFRRFAGGGHAEGGYVAGIPLMMIVRPYRTSFNGRATTQYGVSLELRADSAVGLKRKLIQAGTEFRNAGLLTGQVADIEPETVVTAAAIAAEFESAEPEVPEEREQPDPPDDEYLDGPAGELGRAWDEDVQKLEQPGAGTVEAGGTHTPAGADSTSAPAPVGRASAAEIDKFWSACRANGMTDVIIRNKLGSVGFETKEEITASALSGLMIWAHQWRPGAQQGSLV